MVDVLGPFPQHVFKCGKFFPDLWQFTAGASATRGGGVGNSGIGSGGVGSVSASGVGNDGVGNEKRNQAFSKEHIKENLRQMLQVGLCFCF